MPYPKGLPAQELRAQELREQELRAQELREQGLQEQGLQDDLLWSVRVDLLPEDFRCYACFEKVP